MTAKDNPPHPTWQWIFGILFAVLIAFLAWVGTTVTSINREMGEVSVTVTNTDEKVENLRQDFRSHDHDE